MRTLRAITLLATLLAFLGIAAPHVCALGDGSAFPNSCATTVGATSYTLAGPTAGKIAQATTNFTAQPVGSVSPSVVVTPNDATHHGVFNPATITLAGSGAQTFTYQAFLSGTYNLSATNAGGLTDPAAISFAIANLYQAVGYPGFTSGWFANAGTLATGISGDPWGGANAARFTENTANSAHALGPTTAVTISPNTNYTAWALVKRGTGSRNAALKFVDDSFAQQRSGVFDLGTCAFLADDSSGGGTLTDHVSFSGAPMGANWCFLIIRANVGNFTLGDVLIYEYSGTSQNYTGDGSSSLIVYGLGLQPT